MQLISYFPATRQRAGQGTVQCRSRRHGDKQVLFTSPAMEMVGVRGFEPPTSASRTSNLHQKTRSVDGSTHYKSMSCVLLRFVSFNFMKLHASVSATKLPLTAVSSLSSHRDLFQQRVQLCLSRARHFSTSALAGLTTDFDLRPYSSFMGSAPPIGTISLVASSAVRRRSSQE